MDSSCKTESFISFLSQNSVTSNSCRFLAREHWFKCFSFCLITINTPYGKKWQFLRLMFCLCQVVQMCGGRLPPTLQFFRKEIDSGFTPWYFFQIQKGTPFQAQGIHAPVPNPNYVEMSGNLGMRSRLGTRHRARPREGNPSEHFRAESGCVLPQTRNLGVQGY